jgi:hypothetical protein
MMEAFIDNQLLPILPLPWWTDWYIEGFAAGEKTWEYSLINTDAVFAS